MEYSVCGCGVGFRVCLRCLLNMLSGIRAILRGFWPSEPRANLSILPENESSASSEDSETIGKVLLQNAGIVHTHTHKNTHANLGIPTVPQHGFQLLVGCTKTEEKVVLYNSWKREAQVKCCCIGKENRNKSDTRTFSAVRQDVHPTCKKQVV